MAALDDFAENLHQLSHGIYNISCLTEDDDRTENKDLALALIYYTPLEGAHRMIRVDASWTKCPSDVVATCNRDLFLNVNIGKHITYHDGDSIEKNKNFRELKDLEKVRLDGEEKIHDIGAFHQAFLFIAYEGNFRDSTDSISSDDGPHIDYPGYPIGGLVKVLPANGAVSQGWYRVDIVNRLDLASVIIRLQAKPEVTVFKVLEQAQIAKQCCTLIKTAKPFCEMEWTMDYLYNNVGVEEEDGTRTVSLFVETARSGPDLVEADQE